MGRKSKAKQEQGTDEHSKNTQLINDYAMWFVNYR